MCILTRLSTLLQNVKQLLVHLQFLTIIISGCFKNDNRRKTLFLREMGSKYLYHKYHEEQYGNAFVH